MINEKVIETMRSKKRCLAFIVPKVRILKQMQGMRERKRNHYEGRCEFIDLSENGR